MNQDCSRNVDQPFGGQESFGGQELLGGQDDQPNVCQKDPDYTFRNKNVDYSKEAAFVPKRLVQGEFSPSLKDTRAIVGLAGSSGCGKSTAARFMQKKYGAAVESFAKPLKEMCQYLFGLPSSSLYGTSAEKETINCFLGASGRQIMQKVGTELFKGSPVFSPPGQNSVWIRSMLSRIDMIPDDQDIVIDDVRFQDEVDAIVKIQGTAVLITRQTLKEPYVVHDCDEEDQILRRPKLVRKTVLDAGDAFDPYKCAVLFIFPNLFAPDATPEDKTIREGLAVEVERLVNLLPQYLPNLPWCGYGYDRSLSSLNTVLFATHRDFYRALCENRVPYNESFAQNISSSLNTTQHFLVSSHTSEQTAQLVVKTHVINTDFDEFKEHMECIIPNIHFYKTRRAFLSSSLEKC